MLMKKEEFDAVVAYNKELCICGHARFIHSISDDSRVTIFCVNPNCACKKFIKQKLKMRNK
jgi:hypothetical protein